LVRECLHHTALQALEWGKTYLFKSCAMVDITASADACNGCSGHGTCGANGQCTCMSTPSDGFYYGAHCEYENECATDAHCGAHGKCIEIGDMSGPAKQCFCEAGWFGAVSKSKSGMERRTCDKASALKIDTAKLDMFGSEYNRTEKSGPFSMFWAVKGSVVEVAMVANTTSWVGVGWRSVDSTAASPVSAASEGAPAPEAEAPAEYAPASSEKSPAPSEPAPSAEAPPPAAEPTGRRRLAQLRALAEKSPPSEPEAETEPPAEPAPPASEGAPTAPSEPPPASEAASKPTPPASEGAPAAPSEPPPASEAAPKPTPPASEGAPAAPSEPPPASEAASTPAPAAEAEAATGSTCAAVPAAQVVKPTDLGSGKAATPAEADAAAASAVPTSEGAPAATPEAAAENPSGRRRRLAATHMPELEAEAVPLRLKAASSFLKRKLLQAPAEGEASAPEAAAEGPAGAHKPGKGKQALKTVSAGPCAGAYMTPSDNHAMDNQDIVLGMSRAVQGKQYFRVVDMFTPSRAKPQPDHAFCKGTICGTDDITDAIGVAPQCKDFVAATC
jgi:hypothetical protein